MDFSDIRKIIIEIPIIQIGIFAFLCTIVALWGKSKFLLVIVYGFIMYWVFFMNEAKFGVSGESNMLHAGLLILSGIIFIACSAYVIFVER